MSSELLNEELLRQEMGASAYLTKPFDLTQLIELLGSHFAPS